MAKILDFPGSSHPITNGELDRSFYNEETYERVGNSIGRLLKIKDIRIIPTVLLLHPTKDLAFGTVHHPVKDVNRLAVSAGFPESLRTHAGLETNEALQVAADFIHAFQITTKGLRKLTRAGSPHRHTHAVNLAPQLWTSEYTAFEDAHYLTVPYRAAAKVALLPLGGAPLEFEKAEPPFPPHIAALQNPMDEIQFRSMQNVIKNGVK